MDRRGANGRAHSYGVHDDWRIFILIFLCPALVDECSIDSLALAHFLAEALFFDFLCILSKLAIPDFFSAVDWTCDLAIHRTVLLTISAERGAKSCILECLFEDLVSRPRQKACCHLPALLIRLSEWVF